VPKSFTFVFAAALILSQVSIGQEKRKPCWPLPKAARGISSSDQLRLAEYRNYLQSLTDTELKEFSEDAKIDLGNFGVNSTRLIVKFKESQTEQAVFQSLQFKKPHRDLKSTGAKVIQISSGKNNVELLTHLGALKELEGVEYAYPDYKIRISNLPNDSEFGNQWDFHNTGATTAAGKGLVDADIDAPEAWEVSTGSRSVIVGILDTGMNYNHPDLKENVWNNPGEMGTDSSGNDKSTNGIDDDGNGYIDDFRGWDFVANDNDPIDEHGHGTHTAGTIGAVGNNGIGVSGVNWQVSLVPLQIFDSSGSGDLSAAMAALDYATKMGFPITNNSWGGGEYTQAFEDLLKANRDAGSLFVAAAGNDGSNNDTNPFYPASFQVENVISVAASNNNDQLASFSNYGATTVHLAAPGENIYSTYTLWDDYTYESGTSMASPHVAGAAALIKSVWPNVSYAQIKNKVMDSVDVIHNPSFERKTLSNFSSFVDS
jgi:subtilisin family serine protease